MTFSKNLTVEILSFMYNSNEIIEICFKLNKRIKNMAIK